MEGLLLLFSPFFLLLIVSNEARDRIGGRIWTKDIEIEGRTLAIDLGASFIHSKNTNAIVKIFKQRNIPLDTVECDEDNVSVLHLPPGYTEKQYDVCCFSRRFLVKGLTINHLRGAAILCES